LQHEPEALLRPPVLTAGSNGQTRGIVFDFDGTLVDNTAQHIAAWWEAFVDGGLSVDTERLRPEMGKGGDLFVKAVAGEGWHEGPGTPHAEVVALRAAGRSLRQDEVTGLQAMNNVVRILRELDLDEASAQAHYRDLMAQLRRAINDRAEQLELLPF
jgi:beta-phosphoglucomutase-like phosphatase (HAD superfamily)